MFKFPSSDDLKENTSVTVKFKNPKKDDLFVNSPIKKIKTDEETEQVNLLTDFETIIIDANEILSISFHK